MSNDLIDHFDAETSVVTLSTIKYAKFCAIPKFNFLSNQFLVNHLRLDQKLGNSVAVSLI